jgi:hypothetical protein
MSRKTGENPPGRGSRLSITRSAVFSPISAPSMAIVWGVRPCWASLRIANRTRATAALKRSSEARPSTALWAGASAEPAPTAAEWLRAGAQKGNRKKAMPESANPAKKRFPRFSFERIDLRP